MWNLVGMVLVCEDILLVFLQLQLLLRFLFFVTLWLRGDPAVSSSRTMTATSAAARGSPTDVLAAIVVNKTINTRMRKDESLDATA